MYAKSTVIQEEISNNKLKKRVKTRTIYEAVMPRSKTKLYYVKNFESLRNKRAKDGDIAMVKFANNKKTRYVNAKGKYWKLKNPNEVLHYPLDTKYFFKSCLRILKNNPKIKSGFYTIDSDSTGIQEPFRVYCDMKTDGGGWTRFLKYRDSISYNKVDLKKKKKFVSNGYKIALKQENIEFKELMLNGCKSGKSSIIFNHIPIDIVSSWIESSTSRGVLETTYINSCLKQIQSKSGKNYFYGSDLSHEKEFETIHFSSMCKNGVNGASTTVWGAVDAGNKYRRIWGSVNGINHKWKNDMRYHNDYICSHIR